MLNKDFILDEANKRCQGTLVSTLGINFIDVGEHYLEAKMQVTPAHHQPAGVLHGGATAALAETVGSSAAAIFSKKDTPENLLLQHLITDELNNSFAI